MTHEQIDYEAVLLHLLKRCGYQYYSLTLVQDKDHGSMVKIEVGWQDFITKLIVNAESKRALYVSDVISDDNFCPGEKLYFPSIAIDVRHQWFFEHNPNFCETLCKMMFASADDIIVYYGSKMFLSKHETIESILIEMDLEKDI